MIAAKDNKNPRTPTMRVGISESRNIRMDPAARRTITTIKINPCFVELTVNVYWDFIQR